jgi:acetylornithine deacetylase/succinyl-diaminopimelate desuccinylase-like protein
MMSKWPIDRILDLAAAIQQIPAPTFDEGQRAVYMREQFLSEELQDVEIDELGNVYGRVPGLGTARPLVLSAHTDTVFPAETPLTLHRKAHRLAGPGIGDNALGVAGLLAVLWGLQARGVNLPGDLILVANVGEEGLGNSHGMQAVVERFGDLPLGYIALEGMSLGHIFTRGMEVQRYKIQVQTAGGHSWVDYGKPSAVHALALIVSVLAGISLPERPRTTLNVGVIEGGTTVNTIAAAASCQLDLRSERADILEDLVAQVRGLMQASVLPGVQVEMEQIGHRLAGEIAEDHPLVQLARQSLAAQGIEPFLTIGSTDANVPLSRGLPAICLGLTTGRGAHTTAEYIHVKPLVHGLEQLLQVIEGAYSLE